ncbi:MAG: magnesium transporter [Syntrophobacterales bacterium]|nr:magnesium transporter [Syntrophobacterales bacterium]
MADRTNSKARIADIPRSIGSYRFLNFSELIKRPVCVGNIKNRIGKLTDLVFALAEPYPEAVGIYIEHGWGKPTEFVPWSKVVKVEDDAIFVHPPDRGDSFPPFVDQPGWILLDKHLMGRTILDIDGRRSEVVNDVHLLEAKGRLLLVHVDISMSGFFRRLGLGKRRWVKDNLISWKYVQPLSVEDAVSTDKVTLSITRKQMLELPSEDLADVLEELPGEEQQALFSALDSEKAAETLVEAEPRAQRQIIASLRAERARNILSEMTVPQLVGLFSVLPHDDVEKLMGLLSNEKAERVRDILSEREVQAKDIMSPDFVAVFKTDKVGEILEKVRRSGHEPRSISYVYVVDSDGRTLIGVVDLRELLLAADHMEAGDIMASPVVTANEEDLQEDIAAMFAKYHYEMIPVVDDQDRILGVILHNDIIKSIESRVKV